MADSKKHRAERIEQFFPVVQVKSLSDS